MTAASQEARDYPLTDDDYDRLQAEYDLCGVDGRLRDFAEAVIEHDRKARQQEALDARRGRHMLKHASWVRREDRTFLQVQVEDGADLSCLAMRESAIDAPQGAWHGARFKRIAHEGGGESYEMIHQGQWRPDPQPPQGVVCKYAEEIGLPPHACMDCSYDPLELEARFKKPAPAAPPQGASSLLPGWRLVPVEPTPEMLRAAIGEGWVEPYTAPRESGVPTECDISKEDADWINAECSKEKAAEYRAMLAASPLPAPQEPAAWRYRIGPQQEWIVSYLPLPRESFAFEWEPLYAAPAPDSARGTP